FPEHFPLGIIADGSSKLSAVSPVNEFSGTVLPAPLVSTRNWLTLRFVSDSNDQLRGFSTQYQGISAPSLLHANFTALDEASGPSAILDTFQCSMVEHIVEMIALPICVLLSCLVQLKDICLATITIFLCFTDCSPNYTNFIAFFNYLNSFPCNFNFTSPSGTILSPNYPHGYESNLNCAWLILGQEGSRTRLLFHDLDLELQFDFLVVKDGVQHDAHLLGSYTGHEVPTFLISSGPNFRLEFLSDHSISGRGFNVSYTSRYSPCGGFLLASSGSILSPGYPDFYPNSLNCTWTVVVAKGKGTFIFVVVVVHCLFEVHQIIEEKKELRFTMSGFCKFNNEMDNGRTNASCTAVIVEGQRTKKAEGP
uniref:CUB domain-containing protein n=1 Tax=Eptatretus burgeri TaxID=7764 RepID=A0A8C4QZN6_EPTBU